MLRLFTTLYPERSPVRRGEYAECLHRNLKNPEIDEICIWVEGEGVEIPESPKVQVRRIDRRPTYCDFFEWIGGVAELDDISIIANTDIWFDSSIGSTAQALRPTECYALARWEGGLLWDRNDSQDSWIFRDKVTGVYGDFPLGVVRCDNRILYELQKAGYQVKNPAFSIRSFHLHEGQRSEYGANEAHFVQPPYRYLWPHNLFGPFGTIYHNLRHPGQKVRWSLDRRKLARAFPIRVLRKLAGLVGR
jgi:hypothetical protein